MKKEEIVCYCSNVTKGDILRALENGARTLSDVRKATGACTKPDCMNKSPRNSCCSPVIMQVIKEYYGIR